MARAGVAMCPTMMVSTMPMVIQPSSARMSGMARVRTGRIWLRMDIFLEMRRPRFAAGVWCLVQYSVGRRGFRKRLARLSAHIHAGVIFCHEGFHTLTNMRDEPMSYSFTPGKSEGTTVLKLVGPLTISTIFGFQNELRATTPQVLIVDMS